MKRFIILLVAVANLIVATAQMPVGQWRACIDHSTVYHVAPGKDCIYAAVKSGLFAYDPEYRTTTLLNKTTNLNDVGISTIAYNDETEDLVVAYTNSNIDIVRANTTYNLSDIKRSSLQGDRNIYSIRFYNRRAYLCCGFGIVVIDLDRHEISETYYLGHDASPLPIYDLAFYNDSIYAATADGLKKASVRERHLSISNRWNTDARFPSTSGLNKLEVFDTTLILATYPNSDDSCELYALTPASLVRWNSGDIKNIHVSHGKLTITRAASIVCFDRTLHQTDSLTSFIYGELIANDAAFANDGGLFIGHAWGGLIGIYPNGELHISQPEGPTTQDQVFRLVPYNYNMYLSQGGYSPIFISTYRNADLYTCIGTHWKTIGLSNILHHDLVDIAINPKDTTEIALALWGYGIATIRNDTVQHFYNADNTNGALHPYVVADYSSLRTGTVEFDAEGNLWTTCSHQPYTLAVRRTDGSWQSFSTASMNVSSVPDVNKLVCDSVMGYIWFAGSSNRIYVHDGKNRMAYVNPNNGSKLETETINAMVQDQNGDIWIGTNKGIKVIYDTYHAFSNGGNGEQSPISCSNITITNGQFAEYLMAYENITSIAIDGANRKWVGTANGGLYLISANGLEQIAHFTASNSPLFSDHIVCLAVQPRTGELFVGTDRGLLVYRSDATYALSTPLDHIYAFPNPVRPEYDGPIAVKGFSRNAIVHITDAAGHVVFSGNALGGQVVWNGRTLSGEKVAAGVYYVFTSDSNGGNRSVAKILIVR